MKKYLALAFIAITMCEHCSKSWAAGEVEEATVTEAVAPVDETVQMPEEEEITESEGEISLGDEIE